MNATDIDGALFLCRRVLLMKMARLAETPAGRAFVPRAFSVCVSPFGVRFGIGTDAVEEKAAARAFLGSAQGGFRFETTHKSKADRLIRGAQEALWSRIPAAGRSLFLVAGVYLPPGERAVMETERAYVYNRRCSDLGMTVLRVSRPLPRALHVSDETPLRMWATVGTSSRDIPLLIPARSESEAAIRAILRLSHSTPHPVPEARDLRLTPLAEGTVLEIAMNAGLFAPSPDNDPTPILFA